jgi:cell division protein FtsB
MPTTHRIVISVLLALTVLFAARFVHEHPGRERHAEMERRISIASERTRALQEENLRKLRQLDAASGDPAAIAYRARTEFSFVRADEQVRLFPEPTR